MQSMAGRWLKSDHSAHFQAKALVVAPEPELEVKSSMQKYRPFSVVWADWTLILLTK